VRAKALSISNSMCFARPQSREDLPTRVIFEISDLQSKVFAHHEQKHNWAELTQAAVLHAMQVKHPMSSRISDQKARKSEEFGPLLVPILWATRANLRETNVQIACT
jgi:hypothetical protein